MALRGAFERFAEQAPQRCALLGAECCEHLVLEALLGLLGGLDRAQARWRDVDDVAAAVLWVSPALGESFECDTHRMTLLGVDAGSTVMPSVSLDPSVVITSSETTCLASFSVIRWILPYSSVT